MSNNPKKLKIVRNQLLITVILEEVVAQHSFSLINEITMRNIEEDIKGRVGHENVSVKITGYNLIKIKVGSLEYTIQC